MPKIYERAADEYFRAKRPIDESDKTSRIHVIWREEELEAFEAGVQWAIDQLRNFETIISKNREIDKAAAKAEGKTYFFFQDDLAASDFVDWLSREAE